MRKSRKTIILALAGAWPFGFLLSSSRWYLEFGEWPDLRWIMQELEMILLFLPSALILTLEPLFRPILESGEFEILDNSILIISYLVLYWLMLMVLHFQAIRKASWSYAVSAICMVALSAGSWHQLSAIQ